MRVSEEAKARHRVYCRAYHAAHKERIRAQKKAWYQANKKEIARRRSALREAVRQAAETNGDVGVSHNDNFS